jgi:glycosyltransferase involved in cell wall biosynthesis
MTAAAEPRTRRPSRFAMVTTFYPPFSFGGDGQYVRNLAHALARRGHAVDFIHDADAYRLLSGSADPEPLAEPRDVTVHTLRSAAPALSCLATQQLGRPLVHGGRIRRILSLGFDVIHFHNVSLVGGPSVLSYGAGVKLYTAHEHWLVCPMHTLWRHDRELCTGRECLRCGFAYKRPPQLWRASDRLARQARHVDAFIALSRFSADKHAEFGFTEPMTVMQSFLPDLPAEGAPPPMPGGPPISCLSEGSNASRASRTSYPPLAPPAPPTS